MHVLGMIHTYSFTVISGGAAGRTSSFVISNFSTENTLVFKIKTTAPQRYSVKPNHGKVEPGASATVTVTMYLKGVTASGSIASSAAAAAIDDISFENLSRDKFLVQSLFINPKVLMHSSGAEENISQWWNSISEENKKSIIDIKLRCIHEMADGAPEAANSADFSSSEVVNRRAIRSIGAANTLPPASPMSTGNNSRLAEMENLIESLRIQLEKTEKELKLKNRELIDIKSSVEHGVGLKAGATVSAKSDFACSPVLVVLIAIFAFLVGLLF